jgi:hypothetical protein
MLVSGIIEGGTEDKGQVQQTGNTATRSPQVSLSQIILSLDSNVSKQHALQHLLNALQVLHARDAVVAALSSHSNIAGFTSAGKPVAYYYCKLSFPLMNELIYLLILYKYLYEAQCETVCEWITFIVC